MAQNNYGRPDHGVLQWLPPKLATGTPHGFDHEQFGSGTEEACRHVMKSPVVAKSDPPSVFTHNAKSKSGRAQKRRKGGQWAVGGPGMQAFFLGSGPSTGTGVFLPRRDGPDPESTKIKPAMSPVLLPSHIVQALNLNVCELGQQIIKPPSVPDETKNCEEKIEEKSQKTPKGDNSCLSPEIINLPEEWTY